MNILVIAHYQDDGSYSASFIDSQVRAYARLGHKVFLIVPITLGKKYKYSILDKKIIENNVEIYYVKTISLSNYGQWNLNPIFGYLGLKNLIKKINEQSKIDFIHAHTIPYDGKISILLKRKFNIPVIITTHGSDTIISVKNNKKKKIIDICKNADQVIAVSSKLKKELGELKNIEVILNGIEKYEISPRKKDLYKVVQVSSLIKRKNIDTSIKVINEVRKQYPMVKFLIIGEGKEEKNLKKLVQELDLEKNVDFLGQLPNKKVLEILQESNIFIMPSINEGLGIVYLEAMSNRCITIGTKGEGISDVIENGKNGFLMEAYNIQKISDLIIEILNGNFDDEDIRRNAKNTVDGMTWEWNASEYIKIMKKIIS